MSVRENQENDEEMAIGGERKQIALVSLSIRNDSNTETDEIISRIHLELNSPHIEEEFKNSSSHDFERQNFPKILEHEPGQLDKASEYDYCMVFDVDRESQGMTRHTYEVLRRKSLGFEIFIFFNSRHTHIFVMIRLSLEQLRSFANRLDFKFLLDVQHLEAIAKAQKPPIDILHNPEESTLTPYEMIYMKFRVHVPEDLYWRPENLSHPFRESVRLKLVQLLIESKSDDGTKFILRQDLQTGKMCAFFPLHHLNKFNDIKGKWLKPTVLPWGQPFFEIKEYFGEKIALYFRFMGHYTLWLSAPAIIGIPLQIYIYVVNNGSLFQITFAVFIVIWAVVMLEFWKRKEKMIAIEWGMTGFEDNEMDRPEYTGTTQRSMINGKETMYFPPKRRLMLITQSAGVIATLIVVVIGAVSGIYLIKRALAQPLGSQAQIVASILNSIQIGVFNLLANFIADKLTERENHRTDTEYEDSMISKLFLFQFVNSYASFFYIAFVAPYASTSGDPKDSYQGDCGAPNCMIPLAINLAIIFGMRLTIGNIMELAFPYFLYLRKYAQESASAEGELLRPEREFILTNYSVMKSSLNDYAEIAINFGFIVLFVTALPIAAFAGFVSNCFEVKADAWKLMFVYQRPIPRGVEDIGMWQPVFTIIASVACITNAALSVFTMDVLNDYSPWFRMWFFVLFQWTCFAIQTIAMALVPDEPLESFIQRRRSDFLAEQILKIPQEIVPSRTNEVETQEEDLEKTQDLISGNKFIIHEYSVTGTEVNFIPTGDIPIPTTERKNSALQVFVRNAFS